MNYEILLNEFKKGKQPATGKKIEIQGIASGKDVYNITAPFKIEGVNFILGREENNNHSKDSKMVWVKEENGVWKVDRSMPSIYGEDPCITRVKNKDGEEEIVAGLVKVRWGARKAISWKMDFYKGKNFDELKKSIETDEIFASGPKPMKDIRLVGLPNGKIEVFTRPQGGIYGLGKIGYIELDSLNDFNEENLLKAEIIENMFSDDEWGGVNEVHVLEGDRLGVLGHVANDEEDKDFKEIKHYYAITFIFDPKTKKTFQQKIIATSDNFPSGEAKRPGLQDVIFSGGLIRHDNATATLYVGLRDKETASIKIKDPFLP